MELERSVFNKAKHEFEYVNKNVLIAIDGIPLFGSDGEMPKYVLSNAILKIGNKTYKLQIDNMYNPWFGNNANGKFFKIENNGNQSVLKGVFSDGAGTYGAEWLIFGNSSIRTILTNDEDILFKYFEMNQ
ncbi:hypothetical protein FEDK69T_30440 [Flavobacterium enshiense DK69]|uniref:Uncharacterized protein n=1 Tax=Flavobacterium enshiense DK69 TaxID=1107311 RepID=V6S0F4_9FLAO|nr:hypothetical protein FEDK69T_30440 [Flavobacterium enshiense DK69]KGO92613.1 hypothetical protein Q767_15570 [Flavobacterium enshiense DK69]